VVAKTLPRYPIYIPSKGRIETGLTARFLARDGVPFHLVVEPQERDGYAARFGDDRVLVLPWDNPGSVIPARNWIKAHATAAGHLRHWQLDDNIRLIKRRWGDKRIPCDGGVALAVAEDFADRYENVALAGLNYTMFLPSSARVRIPPFYLNTRIYSCSLILNSLPHKWRGRYNEDTDLCLQVLADGWCTILINGFAIDKIWTMQIKGDNTTTLYQGDGRLKMARSLERVWPGTVDVKRRFRRPQHVVRNAWQKFDNPLILKPDINLEEIKPNDYGITLRQIKPIKSDAVKQIFSDYPSASPTPR
jgi:pimeloyl-ACP methyl ester carboxylesterase